MKLYMRFLPSANPGMLTLIILLLLTAFTVSAQDKVYFEMGKPLIPIFPAEPSLTDNNTDSGPLSTNCENSNFNLGTFKGWSGCYGTFGNNGNNFFPCETAGLHPTRHRIMPGPGYYDPFTCDSLITVFPGEAFSARLGDTANGGHAEQLHYQIGVTSDSYLFIYRYAVVLEDQNHPATQQPAFTIAITDDLGNMLDPICGYYNVTAQPGLPGWHTCDLAGPYEPFRWKDWTTVGLDLTPYLGQTIRITFTTRGCCFSAHAGYAYISAYCNFLHLQTALCEGDTSAILTAPPGFTYEWSTIDGDTTVNGDTTQSVTVPNPTTGTTYYCILTAVNGCQVTIEQTLTYTVIHTNFYFNSTCSGIPSQFFDSTTVNQNFVTGWNWNFGDGTIDTVNQNPSHTYATPGTYDVTLISYSTEGCSDTIIKQVSVDSLPDVSNTSHYKIICSTDSTNIPLTSTVSGTLFTWTATATSPDVTGYSSQAIPVAGIHQNPVNNGNSIDSIIYNVVPHKNTCAGNDTNFIVAVYPFPNLVNPILVKSICDSSLTNIDLESNLDTTRFTWTCTASSLNLSGFSDNTTLPDTLIDQRLRNSGFTTDTVYYHIVPHAYGCPGDTTVFKVAVYPVPDISNTPLTKTICDSTLTSIALTSNVTGTTFTWRAFGSSASIAGFSNQATGTTTLNQRLDNLGSSIETVTYRLLPKANGCTGDSIDFVVSINPKPALTNTPMHQEQCNNLATNIILAPNITGAEFTWTATPSSGSITGYSDQSTPTLLLDQTLVNSSYTNQTVTYHITPLFDGCSGVTLDYTVTVYPTPDLSNDPARTSICQGNPTNVTLTSNVATTLFTWTCTQTSGNVTGWSDNGTPGTSLNQFLELLSVVADSVIYHVTPIANGCDGPVFNYTVIVNPVPLVTNNPMHDSICSQTATAISLTATCAGTTYSWTSSAPPAVTGHSPGSGNQIIQTLTNSSTTTQPVTYTVTPVAGSCTGNDTNYVVYVYPKPAVTTAPLTASQCSGAVTNILLTSSVTGSSFSWIASGSSPDVTGFSAGSGDLIAQTLVNSGFVNETVTYKIVPRSNSCDGDTAFYTVTVFPVPNQHFTPDAQTLCSAQATNIQLTSDVGGVTYAWTASSSSPLVTGFSAGTGPLITQTLTSTSNNIETVTYTVTPTANGCDGPALPVTVTVNPVAAVASTPASQSFCSGLTTGLNLTSNVAGTTYAWTATASSPNITGHADGTGSSIVQTLINSGFTTETVTYHLTPTANSCTGTSSDATVTVYPIPDVSNDPMFSELCNGTSTNLTLTSHVSGANFSWTATPSSGNITGWGPGTGTLIDQLLTNTGFAIESVTYHLTPTANGCAGNDTDYVVTIVSQPDVYFNPPAPDYCNLSTTSVAVLSHVGSATFAWTATGSSANITGYANGTGPLIAQTLTNSGTIPETVSYIALATAFGCPPGIEDTVVVTVNPTPHVTNAILLQSICSGGTALINLTSDVTGANFSWTATASSPNIAGHADGSGLVISQPLTNTGFTIETVTYHITPSANSCDGPPVDFVVTVFPTPDVYFDPAALTLCSGSATNIQVLSHVLTTTFAWTATASSANVGGYSGGTGDLVAQTLTNSGTTIETVTYTATPTANSCPGAPATIIVTVNPIPALTTTPMNQTICSGVTATINLTSGVAGTTFGWTASASSPNLAGFSDGSGNTISQSLTNSGYTIETVTYQITPAANLCTGLTYSYIVTVNPIPDVSNNPASKQICSATSTNINLLSNVAGTDFTWTADASSSNITGFGPGNGLSISQVLTNSGLTVETATYHITPSANLCTGIVFDYLVTVYAVPDIYFNPLSQSICSEATTSITNLSTVPGTTFAWTATGSSGSLSGFGPGSGSLISQPILNSGTTIETVTYTVSPTAFGCPAGPSQNVVVTIYPEPAVTNVITSTQQCSASATNLIPTSDVAGTTYNWTAAGSAPSVSGYSDGTGLSIIQTLINTGFTTENVIYTVTPFANGCGGDPVPFTVTVFPVPDVYFTPGFQSFCSGSTTNLFLQSHVTGTSYTWIATPGSGSVSGWSPGSGDLIQQTLINGAYLIETVTYTAHPTANGCPGVNAPAVVTINPLPVVSFTPCFDLITYSDAQPIRLRYSGLPLGGAYSGPGVSAGVFYPSIAGPGSHTLQYEYINTYGCSGVATLSSITVVSPPAGFTCGNTVTDIRDGKAYPTVQIGTQCWMSSNLDYGNTILSNQVQRDNCLTEKYCYQDNPLNCSAAGGLYQWDEMMGYNDAPGSQGFCPPGWHIPAESEWLSLFNFYISSGFAGSPLKSTGYSGFNAFLTGVRFNNANWNFSNFASMFWSSTPRGPGKAWAHGMNSYNPSVSYYPSIRTNAFSVRCIKD